MDTHQQQPKGFTLLELLLVFAVIIGIVLASYHRYKQYLLDKDLATIKQNVALLLNATNIYYAQLSISKDKNVNPAFRKDDLGINNAALDSKNLWPKNLLSSNLVADKTLPASTTDYVVSASEGIPVQPPKALPKNTPYYTHQLIVTVTLDSKVVDQDSMDWYLQQLGASSVDGYKLQWIQMPSYTVKGIDSNLWMMEGGLATFKKALEGTVGS